MVTTGAEPSNHKDGFPIGMRVLAVDDDRVCLRLLETMLLDCGYKVTATQHALRALELLRENKDYYDLVISDVQMPDMDGFKLLEIIGLEMDLPVIMLSVNSDVSTVMRGILHGACDYLVKPVRLEELRTIWKHVVRKSLHDAKEANDSSDRDVTKVEIDNSLSIARKCKDQRKVREDEADENIDEDLSKQKKPRVIWSSELHMKFIKAVNQIGLDRAVPKRILELMNVQGITRENVASHLQKYRKAMKKNGNAMRQYYLGVLGLKDFGVSTPGSSLMSFNHQVCSKVNSLGGHNSNEHQLHRGIIPFSQPQNSHNSIAPVTPLHSFSFNHQDSLSQHVASSAPQIGQFTVQQPGYSSDCDGTINIQSGFNGLSYEHFFSQANQAAGSTDNISQNQWAGSANHGHASVQLPGCHSNLNSTDITFGKISSQNSGWINSASCELNVLIPDLGTGGQTSEDVLNEKHFKSTNHAGLTEHSSREAMFHPNNCDSEDDLHTVLKQVLPLQVPEITDLEAVTGLLTMEMATYGFARVSASCSNDCIIY